MSATFARVPSKSASVKVGSVAAAVVLLLTSCTSGDDRQSNGSGSDGLPIGATQEEYISAFEDLEPITLRTQAPAAKGSVGSSNWEAYFHSIEEWSGGKITMDIGYSYAYAGAAEADEAIADGRLDIAGLLPSYDREKFPVFDTLANLTYLTSQSPLIATAQADAYLAETAWGTPEFIAEFEDQGMVPLVTINGTPPNAVFCTKAMTSLDEIAGAQVMASSAAGAAQLTAVGMTAVAIPFTEAYESLERGIVDCAQVAPTYADAVGTIGAAPFAHFASSAGLIHTPGVIVANKDVWDGLPLVAQQLIFDRQVEFLEVSVTSTWDGLIGAARSVDEAGGEVLDYSAGVQELMISGGNDVMEQETLKSAAVDGADLVARTEDASERWERILIDDLGFDESVDLAGMAAWLAENEVDLVAYSDRLVSEFLGEHRPS